LRLEVRDDGAGFDLAAAQESARSGVAMGLGGIKERVAALGGELHLRSSPGRGTEVRALFPLRIEGEPADGDDERRSVADEGGR
jgi:signal transduction histidine kinase